MPGKAALEPPVLHRAARVVPIGRPAIEDGAVLVQGGLILDLGPYRDLKAAAPSGAKLMDHGSSALLPGLVNAHTHLELSGLAGKIPLPRESFADWLKELLPHRPSLTKEALLEGLSIGKRLTESSGTCLYGDVSNVFCEPSSQSTSFLPVGADSLSLRERVGVRENQFFLNSEDESHLGKSDLPSPCPLPEGEGKNNNQKNREGQSPSQPGAPLSQGQSFLEVLGFNCQELETALQPGILEAFYKAAKKDSSFSLAAHACYSTSSELIQAAKEWTRKRGRVFSIHAAEHLEEVEFLHGGSGFFRELLENLGRWVPGWTPPGISPVAYLEKLGVLDERTLLVHAVHMSESDWKIVSGYGCSVCFCPRSNKNLNTGRADIEKALRLPVPVSLGTDSLASNTDLSLFNEAAHVLENYPDISPENVLCMITRGGARALSQLNRFGTIEKGKRGALLAVELPESVVSSELAQTIIFQGKKGAWQWASCPTTG